MGRYLGYIEVAFGKMKIKELLSLRVYILLFFLVSSLIVINLDLSTVFGQKEGVAITNIAKDSPALFIGLQNPQERTLLRNLEVIEEINNQPIKTKADYYSITEGLSQNDTIKIKTNKKAYDPFIKGNLSITVIEPPTTNLIKGLDLQGGTRVILKPEEKVTQQEIENLRDNLNYRLNVYGLSDITVRTSKDLLGDYFVIIEIAGATKENIKELVTKQGKFEAKIGSEVVFVGGEKDIVYVCKNDGSCSGIRQCDESSQKFSCTFEFVIQLSQKAAKRHAEVTSILEINTTGQYLSKTLDLYLDDKMIDSLQISADLKGQEATRIAISGPGFGANNEDALRDAINNMNRLQTVLITGSLPFKLNIVKMDNISPTLGEAFTKNIFLVSFLSILAVVIVLYVRYRRIILCLPVIMTMLSELIIVLGFAALLRYNLDLAAIAGIIMAVGTGIDDQVIILDETLRGDVHLNIKQRIKRAFFIILASYATIVVAMLPLLRAGAGLLTGFAITTILGVSIGVFITRPAYGALIKWILETRES